MVDEHPLATTSQEAVGAVGGATDRLLRPARLLLGWLPEERALLNLNSNDVSRTPTEEQRARYLAAVEAVQRRPPGLDQTGVVEDLPPGVLDEHVARLASSTAAAPFFTEGWRVASVDLARVAAFQPAVFTDSSAERAAGIDPGNLAELAGVTLPTEWQFEQQAQLDEARHQWLLVSRNPNLRIVGHYAGNPQPGSPPLFGFFATIVASFVNIARYHGRYFLRDGYHRSIGLLAVGARRVPAFVRDIDSIQALVPSGMLPQEAFLGERPPTLTDYTDDVVSAAVQLPASQKMIVVQALELSPQG